MFTVTKEAPFIGAVYNKIEYGFENTDYSVGKLFFLEVYALPNNTNILPDIPAEGGQLLTTLVKNGSGAGKCIFDVSSVLQTLFSDYQIPDSSLVLQKDTSAIRAYYVKAGLLSFNGTLQVRDYHYNSEVQYALRAALRLEESENLSEYAVDYVTPVSYLNNQPETTDVGREQNVLLCFLLVDDVYKTDKKLHLIADKYYLDGTSVLSEVIRVDDISSGGVYSYAVSPKLIEPDVQKRLELSRYDISVELLAGDAVIYTSTKSYTATCGTGYQGSYTSTATKTSLISQEDADTLATQAAQADAESKLTCLVQYSSTKSYTATCGSGYQGSYTSTQTRTSTLSQADADAQATQAAQADAQAKLVCQQVYSSTKSYTAYCSEGYTGSYTSTKSTTSTVSQADADSKATAAAQADAEANLVCTPAQVMINCYYNSDGCWTGAINTSDGYNGDYSGYHDPQKAMEVCFVSYGYNGSCPLPAMQ